MSKVQSTRGFKWMLLVMGVFVLPGLLGLGIWQLGRAEEKQVLIQQWQGSGEVAKGLNHPSLQQFSLIRHQGKFEQERWFLLDNRTFVEYLCDIMTCSSNQLYPTGISLMIWSCSGKCRQKGMMNINDLIRKIFNHLIRQNLHVSSQNHQVNISSFE